MNRFYVYVVLRKNKRGPFYYGQWKFTHEPIYIGKGSDERAKWPHSRFKRIVVKIKRKELTQRQAFQLECKLIKIIGRKDKGEGPLLNRAEGGAGSAGWNFTKEQRVSVSKAKKLHWKSYSKRKRAKICLAMSNGRKNIAGKQMKVIKKRTSLRVKKWWKSLSRKQRDSIIKQRVKAAKNKWRNMKIGMRKQISMKISKAIKYHWATVRSE